MITTLRLIVGFFVAMLLFPSTICAGNSDNSFQSVQACPSDVTIRHILKDSNGFVWFGSDNMVYRYDGIHAIPYELTSDSSDRMILVKDMIETPGGDIIIATDCCLFFLSGKTGSSSEAKPFLQDKISEAKSLALHPDGYLLIATGNALWSYSLLRGTLSRIQIDRDPLSQTNVPAAITPSPKGVTMVAADGGIYSIERNFRVIRLKHPDPEFPRPSKAIVTPGGLYLATDANGLWRTDISGNTAKISEVEANVVTSFANRGDSILYVGTDGGGVYKINTLTGEIIDRAIHRPGHELSLQSNQIYSLMVDPEERLWVGHYQHGADHTLSDHTGVEFYVSTTEDKAVRTINILPDHSIVTGTRAGILILSPNDKDVVRSIGRPLLRSNMVISTEIQGDTLYVGTYGGGLSILSLSSGNLLADAPTLPPSMNSAHIFSIARDKFTGTMWFGTSEGLFRLNKKGLDHFTHENSNLPKGNIFCVFFDSSGKGWIASENGLAIWDPSLNKLRTDCFPDGFINRARIRQIYEGRNRKLYFVLENGKLVVSSIDMSEFNRPEIFNKRNLIKAVAEDNRGFLWLATSHGLMRWDKISKVNLLTKDNGIPASHFIHCLPGKEDSKLWFGNSGGMLQIDTRILDRISTSAPLIPSVCISPENNIIDKFIKTDEKALYKAEYREYSKSLTLKLSTLAYDYPDNSKYEYKVNDGDWIAMPPEFSITLHDLPRGETKIFVRPLDDWSDMTTISVEMPYSVSLWIWIVTGVVLLTAITGGLYIHLSKRNKKFGQQINAYDPSEEYDGKITEDKGKNEKYATFNISKKECAEIMKNIHRILTTEKPYTNPELKLPEVAHMAGISSNKLSYVLRQHGNIGFYDFINNYRIEEFKNLVKSGKWKDLTLTAMSEKAGFSSRTSFFRCFKKIEGITPGEYIKNH